MKFAVVLLIFFNWTYKAGAQVKKSSHNLQFIFTSDAHYGIERATFRGKKFVDGHVVNAALIEKINSLPSVIFPLDKGVASGQIVGTVDFVIEGGDIANRMELPHQSAAKSWMQFETDYVKGLTLKNYLGQSAELLIIPGNHDITNAIGFYKPMKPNTDATSMANIYNLMMKPTLHRTKETYDYKKDKINFSKDINGIHLMFITLWPDSSQRIWMEKDLKRISKKTPVFIFAHDQPECEAKHFSNPIANAFNTADKFENLLPENYKDEVLVTAAGRNTNLEQKGWINFLKRHRNIKAYFHGNSNWNQFYEYRGLNKDVCLKAFRVDSPMKGKYSAEDETKLSFQVITIDPVSHLMTVRECLWNTEPDKLLCPLKWGNSKTILF